MNKTVKIIIAGKDGDKEIASEKNFDYTTDSLERLLKEILTSQNPEAASKTDSANKYDSDDDAEISEDLQLEVNTVFGKYKSISAQVNRVIKLDDDDFILRKAIHLAQRIVKAKMEAMIAVSHIMSEADGLEDDKDRAVYDDLENRCVEIANNYTEMSDDLDSRFADKLGILYDAEEVADEKAEAASGLSPEIKQVLDDISKLSDKLSGFVDSASE